MTLIRFIIKTSIMAITPLLVAAGAYIIFDPFKVLRTYDNYFADGLSTNKGVITVGTFEAEYKANRYDSFILGSSLSCYYNVADWLHHLPAGAVPYHFDSANQSIGTLRRTVEYLAENVDSLKNALIVLDPYIFRIPDGQSDMVFLDPPALRSEWWYAAYFHYSMFRHFMNLKYLASYLPWRFNDKRADYTELRIFEPQPIIWNRSSNEESIPAWDDSIAASPERFYASHKIVINDNEYYHCHSKLISEQIEEHLQTIASILSAYGTEWHIVVGPNLRHEVLGPEDNETMLRIFGRRYHNLGRELAPMMADSTNFYDNTHYRPVVARQIMDIVYQ